jgi:hypothetical protein
VSFSTSPKRRDRETPGRLGADVESLPALDASGYGPGSREKPPKGPSPLETGQQKMSELVVRFLLGGAIVSTFALMGDMFQPKYFAGMAGAAPSVALASLALAYSKHGAGYVALEARSMVVGTFAFLVYGAACVFIARKKGFPIGLGAGLGWVIWLAVAGAGLTILSRFA